MALARPIDDNIYIGDEEQAHEQTTLQRFYTRWGDLVLGGTAVVLFLALWEWAGTSGAINPLFTSAPSRVVNAFIRLANDGELGHDIVVSGLEFLYGFGLSIIVGIPF